MLQPSSSAPFTAAAVPSLAHYVPWRYAWSATAVDCLAASSPVIIVHVLTYILKLSVTIAFAAKKGLVGKFEEG